MISASTINDIVNHIYSDSFFSGFSYSMYVGDTYLGQEVFSEYLLAVCEKPLEKLLQIFNGGYFNYYSANMIRNIAYHKSGKVGKQVKYNKMKVDPEPFQTDLTTEEEVVMDEKKSKELAKELEAYLKKREKEDDWFWYDKELFDLYFVKGMSYREISKMTGIPHPSIFHTVKNLKEDIKNKFGDDYFKLFNSE